VYRPVTGALAKREPETGTERMGRIEQLVAELRRRRVFRALVVWGIVSFAVLQVFEPVMHGLHLPEWTLSFVVVVLGLGFPVTALLAWIFDLTAGGIERTAPVEDPGGAPAPAPGRLRLALLLLGLSLVAASPGFVYFFVWPGSARRAVGSGAAAPADRSVAVLPFVNLSSDKEQEYFSDGIAEEILNALTQVDGLRVIGRTSSFAMKGKSDDLRVIGQRLGAATLLEGSVRKAGSRVRITAQLVEAAGGSHLWSQEFDRDLTDVFAVQEEIARAVVAALRLKLLPPAAGPRRTVHPEAHDAYLQGLAELARGSGAAYGRAVKALSKSVELDPGYAPAWAALSAAHYWAADQDPAWETRVEWPRAEAAAEKAIALAPDLAEGYSARALLRRAIHLDWTGARADLEKARAINPRAPGLVEAQGALLAMLGRLSEAFDTLQQAVQLDPLSANVQTSLATVHLGTGELALAEAAAARALELSPEHGRAARTLGFALLLQGRLPEARAAFHRSSNTFFVTMGDAMVEHALGHPAESDRALRRLLDSGVALKGSYQVAQLHAWRREPDRAFEWLDRALEQHDPGLTYLKYDPLLGPLRADPRFAALLQRLKLPVD
jgi:TolB-like protein